ncbi:hypothetical protein M0R45_035983 [Rubus argutus]|uniref:Uncharacterized protein n=1 Tax=Rubus argutus TaxID=59490 RepID=A0AAW1VYY1_RUBAR
MPRRLASCTGPSRHHDPPSKPCHQTCSEPPLPLLLFKSEPSPSTHIKHQEPVLFKNRRRRSHLTAVEAKPPSQPRPHLSSAVVPPEAVGVPFTTATGVDLPAATEVAPPMLRLDLHLTMKPLLPILEIKKRYKR